MKTESLVKGALFSVLHISFFKKSTSAFNC